MNKILYCFSFLSIAVIFGSCTREDYKKSPNDLEYRIIVDKDQPKAKIGQVIKYNVYWRKMNDSLFLSTKDKDIPLYSQVDSPKFKGDPLEVLAMMGAGDSVSCKVPVDLIFRGNPPAFLKKGDFMKLDITVDEVLSKEDYDQKMMSESTSQLQLEVKNIESYMTQHGLKGIKTPSGIYVVMESEGTGKQPANGSVVKVDYTGRLLTGQQFDSSMEPGREPYQFEIGTHSVIQGWDEGIPYFKEGGKGKLLIPSALGYGERGNGPKIPPNSTLEFDIHLVEVQ
ncbi:MAG TPA: FKBP-type peptidyl-prolyl cis-trans isomerase [Chitinophagales bacterium]|nr:FKBP-type peptidyl-prolyl cis-trans isomerase [Chitinophagales bacterium]